MLLDYVFALILLWYLKTYNHIALLRSSNALYIFVPTKIFDPPDLIITLKQLRRSIIIGINDTMSMTKLRRSVILQDKSEELIDLPKTIHERLHEGIVINRIRQPDQLPKVGLIHFLLQRIEQGLVSFRVVERLPFDR